MEQQYIDAAHLYMFAPEETTNGKIVWKEIKLWGWTLWILFFNDTVPNIIVTKYHDPMFPVLRFTAR